MPLPEPCEVEFAPRIVSGPEAVPALDEVYAELSKRFDSGESDGAHEEKNAAHDHARTDLLLLI